jgi:hypothetical protein
VATYTFPTSAVLSRISQLLLPTYQDDDPIFDLFPIENEDAAVIKWEQYDRFQGLQQVRGLNGEPPKVKRVGIKQFQYTPGTYGEFIEIDEQELTTRRQIGTFGDAVTLDDLVTQGQEYLQQREVDRIRLILWTLLSTGTFSVATVMGGISHTDTYPIQTFTAGVTWATFATATPLANFRAVQLLSRGYSVNFGSQAMAFMNRTTFNNMISNTNNTDIAGRRTSGLLTVLNLEEVNKVLAGEDLPTIVIYDRTYQDETDTFQLFIPNNKVVVVGVRPNGESVGAYKMTRNANNDDLGPGSYTLIEDSLNAQRPPRMLRLHRGHNGGPVIWFPSAVVVMTV